MVGNEEEKEKEEEEEEEEEEENGRSKEGIESYIFFFSIF
jgi:hypothetical protein